MERSSNEIMPDTESQVERAVADPLSSVEQEIDKKHTEGVSRRQFLRYFLAGAVGTGTTAIAITKGPSFLEACQKVLSFLAESQSSSPVAKDKEELIKLHLNSRYFEMDRAIIDGKRVLAMKNGEEVERGVYHNAKSFPLGEEVMSRDKESITTLHQGKVTIGECPINTEGHRMVAATFSELPKETTSLKIELTELEKETDERVTRGELLLDKNQLTQLRAAFASHERQGDFTLFFFPRPNNEQGNDIEFFNAMAYFPLDYLPFKLISDPLGDWDGKKAKSQLAITIKTQERTPLITTERSQKTSPVKLPTFTQDVLEKAAKPYESTNVISLFS